TGPAGPGAVLDVAAWHTMSAVDELVVARCEAPVLDVGCGPGRFVAALGERGLAALGVDVSRAAVASTARRGATALLRDVHAPLPGEGRWGTVLLADGNIGIGGDPLSLLRRVHELLRPGALAVVEVASDDGADALTTICLEEPHGRRSTPMPWAVVGSRRLVELACGVGFVAVEEWRVDHRAFVTLRSLG
ncbi:MAG: class I SAM-dependent methyltransferase, partial [Actinomycetota bacterium]|nr:class I SAM-dependent methyltransferase [Actinomycetota bacterium]